MTDNTVEFEAKLTQFIVADKGTSKFLVTQTSPGTGVINLELPYRVTLTPVEPKPAQPTPPSWDDAPAWAHTLAQEGSGRWYWYESWQPTPSDRGWYWNGLRNLGAGPGNPNPNWRDTLQERPKPEPVCPVCGKPAGEHRDELFCCPRCGGSMGLFEWKVAPLSGGWCSQCEDCWSWGPVRKEKADAIEAGNRRAR